MGLPLDEDELDTPPLEEDDAPEALITPITPDGLDVDLGSFEIPESDPDDGELLDLGSGEEVDEDSDAPHDDGGQNLLPDEPVQLLDLPEDRDDSPAGDLGPGDDLLGDDRSMDDGGEEGFADEEDELDELADGSDGSDADGADGMDVGSDEALPPWAETPALRTVDSSDTSFDVRAVPQRRKELAVGADADGTRLVVMDEEDGAVFLRGDVIVSDLVPELPLAGIGILGGRPIYWVEGDGLYDGHVYIAGTQGLAALAAAPQGLVLALTVRGTHVLALCRPGGTPERIADLRSAPLDVRVRGTVITVAGEAGLEVFTLP